MEGLISCSVSPNDERVVLIVTTFEIWRTTEQIHKWYRDNCPSLITVKGKLVSDNAAEYSYIFSDPHDVTAMLVRWQ